MPQVPQVTVDDAIRAATTLYIHAAQNKQKDFASMLHRWINKNTDKIQDTKLKEQIATAFPPWKP